MKDNKVKKARASLFHKFDNYVKHDKENFLSGYIISKEIINQLVYKICTWISEDDSVKDRIYVESVFDTVSMNKKLKFDKLVVMTHNTSTNGLDSGTYVITWNYNILYESFHMDKFTPLYKETYTELIIGLILTVYGIMQIDKTYHSDDLIGDIAENLKVELRFNSLKLYKDHAMDIHDIIQNSITKFISMHTKFV